MIAPLGAPPLPKNNYAYFLYDTFKFVHFFIFIIIMAPPILKIPVPPLVLMVVTSHLL